MTRFGLPALLLLLLAGCVSTTPVAGVVDPDYAARSFASVMVITDEMTLAERKAAESVLTQELGKHGIKALRGVDHLPPTRAYSAAERLAVARDAGAQALLLISRTESERSSRYYPPSYWYPPWRYHYPYGYGWPYRYGVGHYTPGYTVEWLRARYAADLVDLASGRKAWTGEAGASDGTDGYARLSAAAGRRIAAKLIDEGLLKAGTAGG
ncbi:MAG: hypothetical protein MI806_03460 [Minwuiales bacterium]|nr:hypothetical protein [Minwuiales bacterium]